MSLDIVCFYADLGRPYLPLLQKMTTSAKAVMPNARRVLITSTPNAELAALFDVMLPFPMEVTFKNLCLERARSIVTWMVTTEQPAVFADPDIEFRNPIDFGDYDVGLLWRETRPDQPVNTGLVLAQPGRDEFWKRYGHIVVNLPGRTHGWWCDQLGFALMTGVFQKAGDRLNLLGARVQLLDAPAHCDVPERAHANAWAIHNKGARKGEGWENIYPARSGAGKPLAVSA